MVDRNVLDQVYHAERHKHRKETEGAAPVPLPGRRREKEIPAEGEEEDVIFDLFLKYLDLTLATYV